MANTIYEAVIDAVKRGSRFSVNLKNKSLKVNGKFIIEKGNFNGKLIYEVEEPWILLEELYESYLTSCPVSKLLGSKPYFKAKDYEELTDNEIAFSENRNIAQIKLEAFILCASLAGHLKWKNNEHWFWQSENYKNFIILKEWIE